MFVLLCTLRVICVLLVLPSILRIHAAPGGISDGIDGAERLQTEFVDLVWHGDMARDKKQPMLNFDYGNNVYNRDEGDKDSISGRVNNRKIAFSIASRMRNLTLDDINQLLDLNPMMETLPYALSSKLKFEPEHDSESVYFRYMEQMGEKKLRDMLTYEWNKKLKKVQGQELALPRPATLPRGQAPTTPKALQLYYSTASPKWKPVMQQPVQIPVTRQPQVNYQNNNNYDEAMPTSPQSKGDKLKMISGSPGIDDANKVLEFNRWKFVNNKIMTHPTQDSVNSKNWLPSNKEANYYYYYDYYEHSKVNHYGDQKEKFKKTQWRWTSTEYYVHNQLASIGRIRPTYYNYAGRLGILLQSEQLAIAIKIIIIPF